MKEGEGRGGEGRGRKETLTNKLWDFKNHACQQMGRLIGSAGRT